ncbi:uncharacterized protein LOC141866752 [Acropora palmata]|uniref:uncharacterized protein LOC141866752 n=1 Tax=Acropora palmata TaxID=6131 RepID=UPI003DA11851
MFGRSPPNILATLILSLLVLIQFYSSPTQAKPHQRRDFLSTYTAGTNEGVYERDWQNIVYLKNSEEGEIQKRSPAEVEDQIFEVSQAKTLGVGAKKREGIETPIKALTSDSSLDLPRPNAEENVRSKVDQPSNESLGVEAEQENKAAGDGSSTQRSTGDNDTSSMSTQSESSVGHENDISSASAENLDYAKDKQTAMESDNASATQDKADSSKVSANSDLISENDKGQMEHKSELTSTVDENAQVRSVQESATTRNNIGNVPSDKSDTTEENQPRSGPSSTTKTQQQSQTTIIKTVDKQPESGVSKGTIAKSETSGLISSSEKQEVPTETGPSLKKSSATEEHKPINNNPNPPHTETTSAEPIRDTLGNSGSEIVTTHRRREPELDSEKDTWAKPANDPAGEPAGETSSETSSGPEVGHFQVDDKSADLEINANSAGVKVKAKPASLQVVSRPGSHSASGAQERSFFGHYHYPPFHVHHHWFPLMRRNYGHLHRRHFFNPYSPFAERRNFDSFYGEAPFYRRHLPYWYPHRHRNHFYDSYLYERSRLEEPDEFSRHRRRRHKRRFRHFSRPYRRQFYNNNIPIMNGMDAPPMGVAPEEGTMPQLPIGPVAPYTQRKNIVTPMPPPINVAGNPPPGILGGMNAAMFGMNGIDNLNEINSMNSAFNGLNPVGSFGFNTPQQMGSMGGLPSEITRPFGAIEGPQMALRTVRPFRPSNLPLGSSRKAFKKTSILSGKNNDTRLKDQLYNENSKLSHAFSDEKREKAHAYHALRKKEVNLKSWEKTLKHYHSLTKGRKGHKFRRSTKAASTGTEGAKIGKKDITKIHPQHAKEAKGKRKNEIVMHRPPIIYHPPPEIYHRPDIVVHRAPIMLHRPPIVYHQPPVVVHRPAIIYHQPPIVFHQPPPMVHQPILHSRDTWVTKPVVYHTASTVSHDRTYYGIPSHLFVGGYGEGCHGAHCSYRKGKVPHSNNTRVRNSTLPRKTKRDSLNDYTSYISSLWRPNRVVKRNVHDEYDFITSSDGAKQKLSYKDLSVYNMHKRDKTTENGSPPVKRDSDDSKNAPEKKKKKDVVVNRPPIIYHPPPEIYHRPDIVVHRPPLVIHRPPIIYHQPPVIVHRPAVVYHQPPIVFHQPPPAVSQPLLYSHDSFTVHPTFYATHHGSVVRDFGHYIGVPNVITNYGNPLFGRGPPMGKRSTTEVPPSNKNGTSLDERKHKRAKNESNEKAGKKNTVLVHRPPIIYHPPPEIYHRPIIVVHRPPIMIHRAPILYHQPPVVVHRPAIVYHQPPLIFHQPPPIVHQPVLKSHDTWVSHPVVFPYSSRVMHHHTYVGVPDAYTVHHYGHYGGHGFYKSHILKHSIHDEQHAFERNEITGERKHSKKQKKHSTRPKISSLENEKESNLRLKTKAAATQKGGKKNAVIVRRPPVIYHPPPEIYHRPEIVVHRAPIVIHRAPIIYHQPPVVVHRPAIVYHEPPLIFHQPPPVVHQPVYRSHDAYVGRPIVRLYSSSMSHAGHLYHIPHAYYHGHGGAIHYMGYGKSKVPQTEYSHEEKANTRTTVNKSKKTHKRGRHTKRKHSQLTKSKDKTETGTKLHHNYKFQYHKAKDVTEKAHKKNSVVIHRPPIIYHPPPEIYHRPDIVVHRAPIVLYRAPIVYHQPPVVVHRPAIVYHQPPIVFHQPPPMVNQPVLHSHDTWVSKAVVVPYGSRVHHVATYRGVPHEDIFMHGIGTGAFGKSRVPIRGSRRNEIHGVSEKGSNAKPNETATTKQSKSRSDQGTNRLPIIQHETKHKRLKSADAATVMNKMLNNPLPAADHIKNQARPRTQRALENLISGNEKPVSGAVSITRDIKNVPSDFVSAQMRMQRSINDLQGPMGGSARIQRVIAEQRNKFEEMKSKGSSTEEIKRKKRKDKHKKKKDVVVNRPPIIYHPPPEVYHRPDIVVHRAPILIHRPPIVYHQPPVVVHRPAVVYHQPPIVFHQPAPAVNQPLLFSHDSFVVHPMAFASHMGSVVNDAGHYVGLPHGGVSNYPGTMPHGPTGHIFPSMNSPSWSRRAEVSKPQHKINEKVNHKKYHQQRKRSTQIRDDKNAKIAQKNTKFLKQKSKQRKAYEPKRYQLNSLHVSRSVKTAKRHSVTAKFKQSRSSEAGKRKQIPRTRTGNKRDELLQDNDNERDISPFQGNSNMVATQENQFMSSSDSYPLQNELTAGNNEGIPTPLQQQENLETDDQEHSQPQEQQQDQQQDQQQITVQQPISLPDQRAVEPFQQQLAFPVPMAPIQLPIQSGFQPGFQPAVNLPLEPPIAPLQSVIPGTLPVISSTQAAGQTGAEEGSSARKWQPKHTTIDINVGAKSIVPQRSTKSKKSRKRKLIHSLPAKGKDNQKRAQVSLLTRIPAMQVLPQTFKQNGIMMPAFNTLPVNHRIKENGMLLEELQRQKKNQILVEKIKKEHMKPKENARKRQFFALQQSSLPVQVPFLNTLQVPQIKPNLNQPRVSVHIETAKKKTLKKQGIERNQNKAKQKRQIYGLSELPQEGLTQPLTLESRTQPLGYFPNSVHTPRVSINVVTSKRSRQDFQDIRKRQLLSYPSDVTGTLDEPVQSSQITLLANELPQYNAVQSPNLVQASQSTEDEALQNVIQSNPSIQQQQQLTYLSSKEEGFNNRPKVIVHVEASKRDTKQKKKVHHAPVVHASKLSEKNEGADGYESPKKSKRQLFGTVPLFSSLDQTTLSGELGGVNSARSSVPISSNTQAKRIQKRQFYNYLGGQQEQVLSTQAMKDTNAVEQQQQDMPIQAFDQDSNVQTELPQMNLPQGSELPASNQYQGQIEGAESNQRMVSLDPLGAFHRPRVSINVQTTKSKVPYTLETEPNWSENKGTIYPQKETRKTKRQLEILGGGGILGRRRGTKLLTSPALKKGRGGNLLGLGSNLNKPVEVFADPMNNLLAGRLAGRKRPRLGGIRIPTAAGGVTLKDSVNQIEGPLTPGQGASAILQDNIAEEIAPFVQDSRTTESNPLVPPSAIAGPVLDPFGKGNTGDLPLPDTSVDRAEILPESTLNQAVNLPLEAAAAVSTPERQVLLTPQMLPGAPILPLAPPMLIPQAPPIQSLSAADQNVPDIRNTPPLRPVLPPIIPMPLPIAAAPPSPFTKSKGLFSDSIEDKPSVHVNVQTSRSNVPDAKHRSKGKTRGPPGRG